jgi:hypothetical protein
MSVVPRVPEPSDGDKRSVLLGWLAFHRSALEAKCAGLDAEQLATRSAPPSPLSLLGPVRNLTEMERVYAAWALGPTSELRFVWGQYTDNGPEWDIEADASMLADSMAAWEREKQVADERIRQHAELGPWAPATVTACGGPAEVDRRVRPAQRARRPNPRADRRTDRRMSFRRDHAGGTRTTSGMNGRRLFASRWTDAGGTDRALPAA